MECNSEYFLTKLGISFTHDTVDSMRWFSAALPNDKPFVLLWAIQRDAGDRVKLVMAGDYADKHPTAFDIKDEVSGLSFYWCIKDAANIDLIRGKFHVQYKWGSGNVELIPR